MQTIIPFPVLHAVGSERERRPPPASPPLCFPGQNDSAETAEPPPPLPEGESTAPEPGQLPRARALNADIVGLIKAVRGRFG